MKQANTYTVEKSPSTPPLYLRALKPRTGFHDGDELPQTRITWSGFTFDEATVTAYADACQYPVVNGQIPLFFPHSFFGPLHLLMLTDENFPLKVIGGVHLRNHLIQHAPLYVGSHYDAAIYLTAARRRPQGLEVDFRTEVREADKLLWESVTTFLFRKKFKQEDTECPMEQSIQNIAAPGLLGTFPVPANTGKRFGMITKDINPIHMSKWLAKLFGFKRDLCHGMWALGRSLPIIENKAQSEGIDIDYSRPVRSDVAFKGPLYIGQDIIVKTAADSQPQKHPLQYELYSGKNERPCVVASIGNTADGA